MSTQLPSRSGEYPEAEKIPRAEVLSALKLVIDSWDFDNPLAQQLNFNNNFALNIAHWVLEYFGQPYNSGEFYLFPKSDGFKGEELPDDLKQLVIRSWGDELLFGGENKVRMNSHHVYIEDEPEIPEWQEIRSRFTTYQEIIDYVASHPEIVAAIKQRAVSVMQQVCLRVEPGFSQGWGLEYLVNDLGIKIAPYGRDGCTREATEYVLQNFDKETRLARTVCDLAFLAAHNSDSAPRAFQPDCFIHLRRRLDGEESIPLCIGDFKPNPSNALVDLVIRKVI